jgi:hypothetical protein
MLHTCVQRFDVISQNQKILERGQSGAGEEKAWALGEAHRPAGVPAASSTKRRGVRPRGSSMLGPQAIEVYRILVLVSGVYAAAAQGERDRDPTRRSA